MQRKDKADKDMAISSTAFAPDNNRIDGGGMAYLVSLTRVGRMMPAERDTYKRVYNDEGTGYSYPKISDNQLQKKGELYFKNMEITGSKKGTKKDPKFDLLSWFKETEIPALDALCRRVESECPGKKAIIRYQMDGAGPHTDGKLQSYLKEAFSLYGRGWMLVPQPSNSPITNTKDDSLFPSIQNVCQQNRAYQMEVSI